MFTSGPGFSIRFYVVPTKGGKVFLWLCSAPLKKASLKTVCEERSLDLASPLIPTAVIKLPSVSNSKNTDEALGTFLSKEKGEGVTQWG